MKLFQSENSKRLSSFRSLSLQAVVALSGILCAQSNSPAPTVALPSTGAGRTATATKGADKDSFWRIVETDIPGASTGPASIVDVLPGGWTKTENGSAWISWDSNQTNAARPGTCCQGAITYEVKFEVTDAAKAVAQLKVSGDEEITMYLNGTSDTNIVYSTISSTFTAPVAVTLVQGAPYTDPGGYSHTVRFVTGVNTLRVEVLNFGGGPTGLYINTVLPGGNHPHFLDSAPADGHADATPDPVDSGTGQFYDTETDFNLGGTMSLGFERYYGSQFANSSFTSALGANWMGSYDVNVLVTASQAQVLLFGGRVVSFANAAGLWQLTSPLHSGYQFASVAGGFKFMDPGSKRIYTFSTTGALVKIEDRNGNAINVTQGANGPTKVSDGVGRSLDFTYAGGQVASATDQSGRTVSFTYAGGLLASVTDAMKAVTTYAYATVGTSKGLLTKETLPLRNAPVSQIYDAKGRVMAQTDGNNNTSKLDYDGAGGTKITDPANGITLHKNDSIGDIGQVVDPLGGTTNAGYDNSFRRVSVTDRTGGQSKYNYHAQTGYISSITDPVGNLSSYGYTAQTQGPFTFYNLTQITYPDKTVAGMTYDPAGNLLTSTMPDAGTRKYVYDSQGRVTTSTDALGKSTSFVWNADNTLATEADALGNTRKFEYNPLKRLSRETDPNGSTVNYVYDGNGRKLAGDAPGQSNWTSHFDANGQRDSLVTPLAGRFLYTYTPTGKVSTITDPLKNVTSYSYDKSDRLTKEVNGAGEAVMYVYDAAGRATSWSDNAGPLKSFGYDAESRLTEATDATGRASKYSYDNAGRLVSLTSPGGNISKYKYDSKNNLISRSNPVGDQYLMSYDAQGQLMTLTGPGGASSSFQRDANGNALSFTSPNGNVWTMGYDAAQRLESFADPSGNARKYSYTGTRLSQIDFGNGLVNFTYDAAGRRIKTVYVDGTAINNTYSALGLLTASDGVSIERNAIGTPINVNGITISVDGEAKPLAMTYAAGNVVTYTYDKAGRVNSVSDWTGGKTTIDYDAASRRLVDTLPNGVATTYGYDADGRVNSIAYGTLGSIQLVRDAADKIMSADRNLPTSPMLRDEAKQFSYDRNAHLISASYDSLGNVTLQDNRAFSWNLASQLQSVADPVNSTQLSYDGLGAVSSSIVNGRTQNYVFNHAMKFPALMIIRQGGNDLRYFVYLPDGELLYSIEAASGERHFYHFDEMGNTVFLSDNAASVTDTYAITPYGEIADHVGTADNPFTWQGRYGAIQEGEGLYYLRSRHYDASTARFLSTDPIFSAEPQSSELYAYAGGNPLLNTDPYGTFWNPFQAVGDAAAAFARATADAAAAVARAAADAAKWAADQLKPKPKPPSNTKTTPAKPTPPKPALVESVFVAPTVPNPPWNINAGGKVIGNDGASYTPLITNDGGSFTARLISNDGASVFSRLISNDGAGLKAGLAKVISNDGGSFKAALAGLITNDGGSLVSKLLSENGLGFSGIRRLQAVESSCPATDAKNYKK